MDPTVLVAHDQERVRAGEFDPLDRRLERDGLVEKRRAGGVCLYRRLTPMR
jgi:hypothetical protein